MSACKDFQPPEDGTHSVMRQSGGPKIVWILLLVLLAVSLFTWFILPSQNIEARDIPEPATTVLVTPPVKQIVPPEPPAPSVETHKALVPAGSSVTALLGQYFSAQEILELDKRSKKVFPFTRICAGHPYTIITSDGNFTDFIYEIDDTEQLIISRKTDEITLVKQPIIYDIETELITGVISTSLFDAVMSIGEDTALAIMIADIFQWDIDFILDIRSGDTFQVLVEKRTREGHAAGYGNILAAEFINQGQVFRVARFQDGDQSFSYYDENGDNIRKAFLKAPVSFTRISSGFSMRRFHPISKTWKAHPAIDYVAPVGTPIKTVGDGTISRIGSTKYNGNFIEVRHSNGYRTIYLHMKNFARGMKLHKRVAQGQVIGYLGGTGMATGPHLCFRMKKNGAPVNPAKLRAPAARAISKENLVAYKQTVAPLFARLDKSQSVPDQVARLDTTLQKGAVSINK